MTIVNSGLKGLSPASVYYMQQYPLYRQGSPQKKKSSGCSLKNINLARASSVTLTLLNKISNEQLILKANKLQKQSLTVSHL